MKFREIFEKKSAAPPTLEEAVAEALVAINTAPAPEKPPEKCRITDAALNAVCRQYAQMDFTDRGADGPRLVIDLKGMQHNLKFKGEVETRISTLMDGFLERGGVLEGHKFQISTNSDAVQSLYATKMVMQPAPDVKLDHNVPTMKRVQFKQRHPV